MSAMHRILHEGARFIAFLGGVLVFAIICIWLSLFVFSRYMPKYDELLKVSAPAKQDGERISKLEENQEVFRAALAKAIDDRMQNQFLTFSATVITALLGFAAFFFTWVSIVDHKEHSRLQAEEIIDRRLRETETAMSGRLKMACSIVFARMTWDEKNGYADRPTDCSRQAIDLLQKAIPELESIPIKGFERRLLTAKNNLAFYMSLKVTEDYQEDALDLVEEIEKSSLFKTRPMYPMTCAAVKLAYIGEYMKRSKLDRSAALSQISSFVRKNSTENNRERSRLLKKVEQMAAEEPVI